MPARARPAFFLIALLVAACAGQENIAPPTPNAIVLPRPTPEPCVAGVTGVGAFAQRFADNVAAIRRLVVAKSFDSATTITALRRTSETLNAYAGLEATLARCPAASDLVIRMTSVRSSASKALDAAFAASTDPTIRGSAVLLFQILPDVLALSEKTNELASSIDVTVALAQVPKGAAQPVGSLLPFATAPPRATPRPTRASGSTGGGGVGPASSSYRAAVRYLDSVRLTYGMIARTARDLWGLPVDYPGATPAEVSAAKATARLIFGQTVNQIQVHLSFISKNAFRCLKDAYSADKPLAVGWRDEFTSYIYPGGATPGNMAATQDWQEMQSKTTAFLGKLSAYVSDCR